MKHQQRGFRFVAWAGLLVVGLLGCNAQPDAGTTAENAPPAKVEPGPSTDPDPKVAPMPRLVTRPTEELSRLRDEIDNLRRDLLPFDKELKTLVNKLAKARVEMRQPQEQVEERTAKQRRDEEQLAAFKEAIKKADGTVTFGKRVLTVAQATAEVEAETKRLAAQQKLFESDEVLLAAQIKVRDGLEKQLEAAKNHKSELAAAIEEMEAVMVLAQLKRTEGDEQLKKTVAKLKEDLAKLRETIRLKRAELTPNP